MRNIPKLLLQVLAIALLSASAHAQTTFTLTLYPNYPGAAGVGSVYGNSAPGFSSGSWSYNQSSGNGKAEVYIDPLQIFNGYVTPITIGQIASISYFTNKPNTPSNVDWSFYLYTNLTGSGDTGSFYHSRLVSEPLYSPNGGSYTPNAWTQWNSNTTTGLRVYDTARNGGVQGTFTDPFLGNVFNGPVTYPGGFGPFNYTTETIKYFSLQTGSAWSSGFTGLVDGLRIVLTNGDIGIVNFEPTQIPEPSTWAGGILIMTVGLVVMLRRRQARA